MREFPVYLIPLLPLLGAVICLSIGRRLERFTLAVISSGMVVAAFLVAVQAIFLLPHDSLYALVHRWKGGPPPQVGTVAFSWIQIGSLSVDAKFVLDPLSALMVLVVTGIGSLIHIYSYGYMHEDQGFHRYMGYLNLFTGSMLILVTGGNLVLMFVGWEGVGLCSYLLIGFWFDDEQNASAGRKAFVVNRIGDAGFLLGIFLLFGLFGTVDFGGLAQASANPATLAKAKTIWFGGFSYLTFAAWLLFIGCAGKSAQIPLYVWLPDAMRGPTPVSALIHAATMVTAGVYMIARLSFIYVQAPAAMATVAGIGAATALFAALMGCAATDLKKVLAYSTVSQLGFMFVAVGTAGFTAGIFHLFTHAFFKACLFLGAGSVLHAIHMKQVDVRGLGGLGKKIPITRWTFLISCLAIAGVPGFSGFFSKDEILLSAFSHANRSQALLPEIVYPVMVFTAMLTAFYMFRLYFLTFSGKARDLKDQIGHAHESGASITWTLIVLAVGAVLAGVLGLPHFLKGTPLPVEALEHWLHPVFAQANPEALARNLPIRAAAKKEHIDLMLMGVATAAGLLGIALAYFIYGRQGPKLSSQLAVNPVVETARRGFYIDELYDLLFVRPYKFLARQLYQRADKVLIDTILVKGSAVIVDLFGRVLRRQNGDVQRYAVMLLVGAAGLAFWISSPSSAFEVKVGPDQRTVQVTVRYPDRSESAKKVTYQWDWESDGKIDAEGLSASHTYTQPNRYTIRLTVYDPRWKSSSVSTRVVEIRAKAPAVTEAQAK